MKRYLPFVIVFGVLALALAGGWLFYRSKQEALTRAAAARSQAAEKSTAKRGAEPPHVHGSVDALVTLEEFGDFQCPPCARVAPVIKQIEKDYGDRLRVVFRQYPMATHNRAFEAACAAEAAGLQGRFWEMHELLYANQWIWARVPYARTFFVERAGSLGLDVERFKKDMDSEQVKTRIAADRERATSLGVDRTPIIFVDNRRLPESAMDQNGLRAAIDAALNVKSKRAGQGPRVSPSKGRR